MVHLTTVFENIFLVFYTFDSFLFCSPIHMNLLDWSNAGGKGLMLFSATKCCQNLKGKPLKCWIWSSLLPLSIAALQVKCSIIPEKHVHCQQSHFIMAKPEGTLKLPSLTSFLTQAILSPPCNSCMEPTACLWSRHPKWWLVSAGQFADYFSISRKISVKKQVHCQWTWEDSDRGQHFPKKTSLEVCRL